ncbi:DMT family transporter [Shewanella sp. 202IG2-18]|uniref:DMT family transporter n=1 Tax=Parashewanella hymeniacidonis TaxID=2807618 RepID=UPI001961194B|nr:DMT family transporter [Parashewanella hymeniacidonis]MBM7074732.1 DMT family transporter [Parashewanella hymeniacidonis]
MTMVLLGLLNGILIALARTLNGMLSVHKNAFVASTVNHFVGFIFLSLIILLFFNFPVNFSMDAEASIYLGGIIGALYVAINSFVFHKVGAVKAVLFILSGQMITSILIDGIDTSSKLFLYQVAGLGMIISGMYLSVANSRN